MTPEPCVAIVFPAASSGAWAVVAAVVGAVAGHVLVRTVGGWVDSGVFEAADEPPVKKVAPGSKRRWIKVAAAATAVGLWWWEVRCLGLGAGTADAAAVRCTAHAVLAFFLAAAVWIDIRYRLIPDAVTVPGVLLGLSAIWLCPDLLLPITRDVPRTFASPLPVADVLAWHGPFHADPTPVPMGGAPHLAGLVVSLLIFGGWWWLCTAPFLGDDEPGTTAPGVAMSDRRRIDPRTLMLFIGAIAISAAWWSGGPRLIGLQSGLIGLAVSAGLVWAVREGASRALGREAMGLGDVTLMAMVGAWMGWQASVLAFFLAAFIGLAHGVVQLARHRENELPYGPSLCMASMIVILAWKPFWRLAEETMSQPLLLAAVLAAIVLLTAGTLAAWRAIRGGPRLPAE